MKSKNISIIHPRFELFLVSILIIDLDSLILPTKSQHSSIICHDNESLLTSSVIPLGSVPCTLPNFLDCNPISNDLFFTNSTNVWKQVKRKLHTSRSNGKRIALNSSFRS